MKKLLAGMMALSLVSFAAHTAHAETDKITVNGMVCAFCAQGLEKSFGKMSAVDKVNVSLDNMLVTIYIKDGQALGDDAIKQTIKENGLDTVTIERTNP